MDWLTLTVEIIGGIIVCTWAVVPVREFREIYRSLKHRSAKDLDQPDRAVAAAEGALPVVVGQDGNANGDDGEGR